MYIIVVMFAVGSTRPSTLGERKEAKHVAAISSTPSGNKRSPCE
jgi:hypothetical protein